MKQSFDYWKKQHDGASLEQFNDDTLGQLWLKPKSVIRPELIKEFTGKNNIRLDLFNNPVGCLTSLADLAYFLQKYAKSARFLAEVVQ
jgi:hypothetical protein